jgi:hypothetical protein
MVASVTCVFAALLVLVLFAIFFSMHLEKWREGLVRKKGGLLLSVRTNLKQIRNITDRQQWACPIAAERAMHQSDKKRCLMFRQGTAWYVIAGDSLTIQPDRNGSLNVRFTYANAPLFTHPADENVISNHTFGLRREPVTSTAIAVNQSSAHSDWVEFPNSAIAMTAVDTARPMERFGTLEDARARVQAIDASDKTYIVGGSPTDPTYYVVGINALASDNVAVYPVSSGTTVYRREKKNNGNQDSSHQSSPE